MRYLLSLFLLMIQACTEETLPPADKPYVRTGTTVAALARTSAICSGEVIGDYGATVTQRGLCWTIGTTPTINNSYSQNGSGTGAFTHQMLNLTPARNYYVRAYAINAKGISYGQTFIFTTPN